jgi:chromosome segregation ATPase
VLFAAPVADTTADQLSEAAQTISSLSDEVDELRDKLAVENMDATEAGKTEAAEIIADLREQLRVMRAELGAMRISRDRYQAENAELMKQIKMNKRELDKARAA